MKVPTHQELLDSIASFRARHGAMRPTRFGREATGEPQLIASLEAGRSPSLAVLQRIADYMRRKDVEAGHTADDTEGSDNASSGKIENLSPSVAA